MDNLETEHHEEQRRFTFSHKPIDVPITPSPSQSDDEGLGRSPNEVDTYGVPSSMHSTPLVGGDRSSPASSRHAPCRKLNFGAVRGGPLSPPRASSVHRRDHISAKTNAFLDKIKTDGGGNRFAGLFNGLEMQTKAELAAAYFNTAVMASSNNNHKVAINNYEAAAKLGHTKSKVNLAQIYLSSSDVALVRRGKQLLGQACHERDAVALAFVGAAYRTGSGPLGVRRDPQRAARILRAAVKLGNPDAMLQLSIQLSTGDGVEKSEEEAFKLCKHAARFRAAAQRRLARLYSGGLGVDADQGLSYLYRESARYFEHSNLTNLAH